VDDAIDELAPVVGRAKACDAVGRSRATHYRRRRPPLHGPPRPRPPSPRALPPAERDHIVAVLDSERFCDLAPAQVWARLIDQGCYLCSISTMYRLLRERHEVRERRRHATHPALVKPELVAHKPNQVWSWDITKLRGPYKWTWFYLYVILDVFSRYAIGWAVAARETAPLAQALIGECLNVEGIQRHQLTIHADRGSSMTSKPVALLLADLGVTRSHSRPHVSDDNPYSEAQFKTLKYFPAFPDRFTGIEHARSFCDDFFAYYNHQHRHSGLALLTPGDVHHGHATTIIARRQAVLDIAYAARPERFRTPPRAPQLPDTVYINRPTEDTTTT
jgi:putative transposase